MQQSSTAAQCPLRTHGTFSVSDLPDEVLLMIMDKVDDDKDMHSLISTSRQVMCAALRTLRAGRLLSFVRLQRFEVQLSRYSRKLQSLGAVTSSLKVVNPYGMEKEMDDLLQLLTPCVWLVRLVLVDCPVSSISNLPHLKHLNICKCSKLSSVSDLPNLQQLFAYKCDHLDTFSSLPALQQATVVRCKSMKTISNLDALSSLHVSTCNLTNVSDLPNLQHLSLNQKITGYRGFSTSSYDCYLPLTTISNLPRLEVILAEGLSDLEAINGFPALKRLCLKSCSALQNICNLTALQELSIANCAAIEDVSSVPVLWKLHMSAAAASWGSTMHDLRGGFLASLSRLATLVELQLDSCKGLIDLQGLQRLQQLTLCSCSDIQAVDGLSSLQRLLMTDCSAVQEVSRLPSLQSLDAVNCPGLRCINGLPELRKVKVSGDHTTLIDVPALRSLDFHGLIATPQDGSITRITGQEHLPRLQHLHLRFSTLQCISNQPGLVHLQASYCSALTHIVGMPALQRLDITHCQSLEALQDFPQLQVLSVGSCDKLSGVSGMPRLLELKLKYCRKIHSVTNLPELLHLEVQGHGSKFHALTDLPKLRRLQLEGCNEVTTLNGPPALQQLRVLNCKQLLSLSGLPQLRTLFLESCDNLQHLADMPKAKEVVIVGDGHAVQMQNRYRWTPRFSTDQALTQLSCLPELQYLECSNPPGSISTLTALTKLSLFNTRSLEHIRGLPLLQHLSVVKCGQKLPFDGMPSADGVCDLPALTRLELSYCSKLPSIANFPALRDVQLFECPQMKDFHNLPELRLVQVKLRRQTSKIRHRTRGMPDVDITYDLLDHPSYEYTEHTDSD